MKHSKKYDLHILLNPKVYSALKDRYSKGLLTVSQLVELAVFHMLRTMDTKEQFESFKQWCWSHQYDEKGGVK